MMGHWPIGTYGRKRLAATASPSFEPKPQRRDAEERKEPDYIRHRGHENTRRDRRIGAEAVQRERHQNAAERRGQEITNHGKTDHHAEVGHLEPRRCCDAGDNGEGQAIDQGDEHFAQNDARGVRARTKLTQAQFAARIGVPIETVRNWEQGKRSPRGPARALLKVIDEVPEVAFAVLSAAKPQT